ncbi:hypothetical protein R1sor_004338 [Riccia sorocarpa]|uniref:Vacuolar protein sorting-associated protein 13 VPS13 adaptor binding domain-containing protein n=1 Tax=Riccia sorocarpa TaxID=122646 RepID=A0ABD3HJX3_9MARC
MFGLKERVEKYVVKYLRPWVLGEVNPDVQLSTSGVTMQLERVLFSMDAFNGAAMQSSPLLLTEAERVETVKVVFTPFRTPVVTILVQGLHPVLQPRSNEDKWWEVKKEKTAEQQLTEALQQLDSQGAAAHALAENLARGKAENKYIKEFVAKLALSCVKIEFRDCSVRIASHPHGKSRYFCYIPVRSFLFGEEKALGFSGSGGLAGAVTRASRSVWRDGGNRTSSSCSFRGLGLQVETRVVERADHTITASQEPESPYERTATSEIEEIAEDYLSAQNASQNEGISVVALPEILPKDRSKYVVIFEQVEVGFSLKELSVDSIELDTQEAAVGLDFQEIRAFQILLGQIKGPTTQKSSNNEQENDSKLFTSAKSSSRRRSPLELWKLGIRKAIELSSRRRLRSTIRAGVMRRRYSALYEAWLFEIGWGQKKDGKSANKRSKKQLERIQKLSEDLSALQKELPLEAVALGRRIARLRVSAHLHSEELRERSISDTSASQRDRMYSSFQTFMNVVWHWVTISSVFIEGKASGISGSLKAAWRSLKNRWRGVSDSDEYTDAAETQSEASVGIESSTSKASSVSDIPDEATQIGVDKYFQFSAVQEESEAGSVAQKWTMAYAVTIRKGSIVFVGGAVGSVQKGESNSSSTGGLKIETNLVPAIHLTWDNLLLAYGSSGSATGYSITCGSLQTEVLSVFPSQLPEELTEGVDSDVVGEDLVSLGRWAVNGSDRALLVSTRPCPGRNGATTGAAQTHPLGEGMYSKHWSWQDRRLGMWDRFQAKGEKRAKGRRNEEARPFLIAEYESLDDASVSEDYPGSTVKCSLAMGHLEFSLKSSYLSRIRLLLDAFTVSENREDSKPPAGGGGYRFLSRPSLTLEEYCDEKYRAFLDSGRKYMISAVPVKTMVFTAVIDGPRIRLSASANELVNFQIQSDRDEERKASRYDPAVGATVVVDSGRWELAVWPPSVSEEQTDQDSGVSSTRWAHSVVNKAWLIKPPLPDIPEDFGDNGLSEHEQVANNLHLSLSGAAVDLELRREGLKKLPMAGPLEFIMETSACWDQFSSLFSASKCVCAAAKAKIPSFNVHAYIQEMAIMLQVLALYTDSLKPSYVPDSTIIVKNGMRSAGDIVGPESLVENLENGEGDTQIFPDVSESSNAAFFAFRFSLEVGEIRTVLGDARLEDGQSEGLNRRRKDEGLRYAPREERVILADTGDDAWSIWEQKGAGVNTGRESYMSLESAVVEFSLGDGLQLNLHSALTGAAVRLIDCNRSGSRTALNDFRNGFFGGSPGVGKSPLTLTELSVSHSSLKLSGPDYNKLSRLHRNLVSAVREDIGGRSSVKLQQLDDRGKPFASDIPSENLVHVNSTDSSSDSSTETSASTSSQDTVSELEQEEAVELNPSQGEEADTETSPEVGTPWLLINVEVDKLLVTDGSLELLVAKVGKVARGFEVLHLDFKVDSSFKNISLDTEGGLVLFHTEALATLVHFSSDIQRRVRTAGLVLSSSESKKKLNRDQGLGSRGDSNRETVSFSDRYRSSSLPALPGAKLKKFKRTNSAPPGSSVPGVNQASSPSPKFGGSVSCTFSSFSLVLARRRAAYEAPGEGILFELEVSSLIEVEESVKKIDVNLTRFTILGLQTRVPGNTRERPGRLSSRAPQFVSSFRKPDGKDDEAATSVQEKSSGLLESMDSEDLGALDHSDSGVLVDKEAQKFGKALSEFNSFILEKLSVSCILDRVAPSEKVWKWSNAWEGRCSIHGLNVAITTSEVQLVESIMSPLSGLTTSSGSSAVESATNTLLEATPESSEEFDLDIPDGAIIAIKDAYEHCYLAAEEVSTSRGNFRLAGVVHYTLAGDKALFKVRHQDPSNTTKSKTVWFSLLSLHAKTSGGEPFRVHYRPGSGLVNIASVNDGSWEQWQFVTPGSSEKEQEDGFEMRSSSSSRVFHLVNQKSKCGIAFEDNVPLLVKRPGNPFKIKVISKPTLSDPNSEEALAQTQKDETPLQTPPLADSEAVNLVTSIPHILCKFDTFVLTVLHEAAGGLHLLPLVRLRVPGTEGVIQAGVTKTRTILQCGIVFEYYETQTTLWVPVISPIETDIFYRARSPKHAIMSTNSKKTPVALFTRLRKVDFVVSEPSLDAVLFLIGVLDLAGPFTVKHSPVRANRCLVENHIGVDLLCRFKQGPPLPAGAGEGSSRPDEVNHVDGMIPAWHSDSFLMRHMTSRRDTSSARVASTLELRLRKEEAGVSTNFSTNLFVSLGEPGVFAAKTRLQDFDGKKTSPGPVLVVDVTRRSQDGIFVTVSPMIRIRNATGLSLELRCRRDNQGEEGAVVILEDGDVIDDSMGAFDALNLTGELKKALSSLNLGNYFLSIRPVKAATTDDAVDSRRKYQEYQWSDDVKGAKFLKAAGLFEKLQYNLQKSIRVRNVESSFGVICCPVKAPPSVIGTDRKEHKDLYFMVRIARRKVPVSRPKTPKELEQEPRGRYTFVAWQEQQEILLLPTVRVVNRLTSAISVAIAEGNKKRGDSISDKSLTRETVESGATACLYIQLGDLYLTLKHGEFDFPSKPISLGSGNREISKNSIGSLKDLELVVDFDDGIHTALVSISRGEDGVLEAAVFTRYVIYNDSHVPLLCCASKHRSSRAWGMFRGGNELEWPDSEKVTTVPPHSKFSWFDRSSKLLVKRTETEAEPAVLDIESLSGSTEISLKVLGQDSVDNRIQLGVEMRLPAAAETGSSCVIRLVPRYIVANESGEAILICQDGFQEDAEAVVSLGPGERSALHAQMLPRHESQKKENAEAGPDVLLTVRFRPKESGWNWSGPVCAAALGTFSVKIRRPESRDSAVQMPRKEELWFAVAEVQEEGSSLITTFRKQAADAIPYHIENVLRSNSITYSQEGSNESEVLQPGASVGYVWDDLGLPHKLAVKVSGTPLSHDINLDKLRSWKSFRAVKRKKNLLQIPFLNELSNMALYGDEPSASFPSDNVLPPVGYEVYADGPTRVLRICEEKDSKTDKRWQSNISSPKMETEIRIPLLTMSIMEPGKSSPEAEQTEGDSPSPIPYVPIITLRLSNVLIEALIPPEYTLCQLKAERLDVDVRWQGAPVAAMLRGHGQDRFSKGQTVLHMAVVISNQARDPMQLKYASILLQAVDLNLDEDTLMKLAPFYRSSLSESTAPSRRFYFERFEIHPIKIVGSFIPGNPRADYSSGQETLRALIHSVIKIPAVRGTTVELNGVLLTHAMLTFKQLALKCAQHYSWYAMRAIYIARGSKLLPPGFASLFDDSAASSLDVFFDPASGSVDLQGLTLGMFGVLGRGLSKKGKGGTQRYLGDLEKTVKTAGSNLLFAVITEVSDSVLKGADASGFDGVFTGFRRGIVNVAMKPSVLRSAVVQGGATRRIKLDRIVGTDEAYIEGYLQAMLDALFKQNYLRVKVIDDQVILKNLPPNTTLMDEIISCVRNFLIGEGLLAGETSAAALSSLRRLRGENERRIGPTLIALCEQLLVIIVVRSLRRQTIRLLHQKNIHVIGEDEPASPKPDSLATSEEQKPKEEQKEGGFFTGINYKRAVTSFFISSALAYVDGRICRHIPNPLVRRIVSGFLLSFVE